MLSEKFQTPNISTGALMREEFRLGTDLGREADRFTREGRLFPDSLALQVVAQWLDRHDGAFIFDGFPRTHKQAEAFAEMLKARSTNLHGVYSLELNDDAIRSRVLHRVVCEDCGAPFSVGIEGVNEGDACPKCGGNLALRSDDTPAALEERLRQYRELTLPVADFYSNTALLEKVDAARDRQVVFEDICQRILRRAA